ncbi:protein apnoia [Diachasmimorpha longicaudata]|uniref:protein apnoia n=1 Tax=Diachasmimorpha longicaudata TaxID=58733 RepID=UPI0030B8FCEC
MMRQCHLCVTGVFLLGLTVSALGDDALDGNTVTGRNGSIGLITNFIDSLLGHSDSQGRTFGMKRIQFMLMPMMYKMGVMMTLLIVLTVMSMKGLMIGIMLLVLKLSAFFGKFYASLSSQQHAAWSPAAQPVHLHVHGGGHHQPHYTPHYDPGQWEPANNPSGEDHYYYKG